VRVSVKAMLLMLPFMLGHAIAQNDAAADAARLKQLEEKLNATLQQLATTQQQVQSLAVEVRSLREQAKTAPAASAVVSEGGTKGDVPAASTAPPPPSAEAAFTDRILDFGVYADERGNELTAKPQLFVQGRYSTLPENNATVGQFPSNFRIARAEAHWSGRINKQFGAGFEIQYHPANDGDPTQLINDAFIQFYPTEHVTIVGGQFNVPFGFDNLQSTARRESPERAMFVGYFFPGHRDRGAMVQGNLDSWNAPALKNVDFFAGVFNGNRFWVDNNRQLNYVMRLRKHSEKYHLAAGVSGQLGRQLLPPGVTGSNRQDAIGFDVQWALHRFGMRAEMIAGDMPSTLLSISPTFAPQFRPGRHAAAGALFATYRLTDRDSVYARYDQFNRDLVNGFNIRAVNFGYLRELPANSRLGIDIQHKNHLSFNDDAVNSRVQVTWGIVF